MKIFFMGSARSASIQAIDICLEFSTIEFCVGGGSGLSTLKAACDARGIRFYSNEEFYDALSSGLINLTSIDCGVSFLFPNIIRNILIDSGVRIVNFHPGILPEYRGCATSCFFLLNSESDEWGVSAHLVDSGLDSGPLIRVRKFNFDPMRVNGIRLNFLALSEMKMLLREILSDFPDSLACKYSQKSDCNYFYYSKKDLEAAKQIHPTDSPDLIKKKIRAFWFPPFHGVNIRLGEGKSEVDTYTIINEEVLEEIAFLYDFYFSHLEG